jgi:SanA protein
MLGSYYAASLAASGRIFDDVSQVPARQVGVVFGCDEKTNGRDNLYFKYRINAAVELWQAGKVKTLIVSGDNRSRFYNEPQKMKNALVSRGIPAGRIVCDFAGLRTLDSVVRAKEVFGVNDAIFITQKFHNERAIYLGLANGMDPVGYNAKPVGGAASTRMKLREVAARVKMGLDVHLLKTEPEHLGAREVLPD